MTTPSLLFRPARLERRGREAALERIARTLLAIVVATAVVSLLGWLIGRPWIVGLGEFPSGLRAATAMVLLLLGTAALLLPTVPHGSKVDGERREAGLAASLCTTGALIIAIASLVERALRDENRVSDAAMPLPAIATTLLLATSIELRRRRPTLHSPADTTAGIAALLSLAALVAQVIARAPLPAVPEEWPKAVPGTAGMFLLSWGVLLLGSRAGGFSGLLASGGVSGQAIRALLPVVLVLPVAFELLHTWFVHDGPIQPAIAATLLVTLLTFLLGWLLVSSTRRLRAYEELVTQSRETGFLSVLSHELRTPLIAIRNLGEIVHQRWDDLDDEQKRRTLATTAEQASRLLGLIQESVMRARLEAGELPNHPVEVELGASIRTAVAEQPLPVEVQDLDEVRARIDVDHLRLMLSACLEHARRCSAQPVTVTVQAAGRDARVEVGHCLERDVGGDDGNDRPPDLWTVAELARLSGGEASYERTSGDRARFVILIPRPARDPQAV